MTVPEAQALHEEVLEAMGKAEIEETIDQVLSELRPWCLSTFPHSTPASCAEHLRREVAELLDAPTDPEEIADCLFLVVDLAQRARVDLAKAARAKLNILKERKWGPPDAQGVVEHVRD